MRGRSASSTTACSSRRSGPDVTTIRSDLRIDPAAELVWSEDAAGNTAAVALFSELAATLTIVAEHEVSCASATGAGAGPQARQAANSAG